jgi:hypothetical protein
VILRGWLVMQPNEARYLSRQKNYGATLSVTPYLQDYLVVADRRLLGEVYLPSLATPWVSRDTLRFAALR